MLFVLPLTEQFKINERFMQADHPDGLAGAESVASFPAPGVFLAVYILEVLAGELHPVVFFAGRWCRGFLGSSFFDGRLRSGLGTGGIDGD